jgi:hypothetical protein
VIRGTLLAAAALAVAAAFTIARPHHPAGPSLRDFEAYYAGGATWMHGGDPYSTEIWPNERTLPGVLAQRYEVLPFVGPPATLPLFAAFARLPYDRAATAWRALLFASLLAMLWLAAPLANLRRSPLVLCALAIAALGFGPVTSALALGQIVLPVALAILAAFTANGFEGKALFAAIACAQPNLALALAAGLRERRNAVAIILGAIAFAIVCLGVVRAPGIVNYLRVLQEHGYAERFSAIQLTPTAIVYGLGANEYTAALAGILVGLTGVIAWFWCARFLLDRLMFFCATCALVPFVAPFFHEHDLAIVLVPAVVLVLRASPAALPVAMAGALFCATDWVGLAQRPDALVQTVLLVAAFALALLAMRTELTKRTLEAVAVILVLIVTGGLAAYAHPMPVWPDGMAPLGSSTLLTNVAAVWHAEQLATGLFARDTLWALLRYASLAGCGLLVYAAIINSRSPADSRTSSPALD